MKSQRQSFRGAQSEAGKGDGKAGSPLFIQTFLEHSYVLGAWDTLWNKIMRSVHPGRGERSERRRQGAPVSWTVR